ncbi:hypothetical protein I3760_11G123200 [Carya illinoinensis]|uniref:Intracellular protein transporter USO1-like protein n=3 Tax=Carya illinoinensis TaxID=32201 RepID=A0A8T1NYN2_CARIL|nr:uncharacterized protein At5g41620 [Carya illinoinensis]KAG2680966.1 hypothetical protein I3760_11G123200 [Carya illinoinensis]KAG6636659.1 hypothetical protein CIPAW_11G126200 [Carya illinoinensis]KAG6688441.1 hypothetical protein I3842_11G125300 [Carya illinoinensis]
MERGEKSGEGGAEKEENLGEKLRRGVVLIGKRGGPCTPVRSWRLWAPPAHDTIIKSYPPSARKLAAALWEFQYLYFPTSKMHRGVSNGGPLPDSRLRRHQHRHYNKPSKDKGLDLSHFLADNSPSSPDQPGSASSLRRHIAASLMQHHRAIGRNNHTLQPLSPASYGSSMEVAPYNPAVTPSSSLDFKGREGESQYNLKTSTELLKVLNRIWSLEEQHVSNMSFIKALKMELDQSRLKIKELMRDRQAGRHEMDDLMKQIAEDKLVRKSKEQERIHAAVQSVRDELEDERKLRKRSESLHRKLARELSEVKSSISTALKELEREKKSRTLLEHLCDEFAWEIKGYEQEVHALKQKSDKDWAGRADRDRLILHLSESWLDERMQMQLEAQHGFTEKKSIVDKLSVEIETFLQAKRLDNSKRENPLPRDRRKSLESVPLNEALSAPQDLGDEEDSLGSDSHCFELNKPSKNELKTHEDEALVGHIDEAVKSNEMKKKHLSYERLQNRTPSSLQVKFEEQMAWAMSCNGNKNSLEVDSEQGRTTEGKPIDVSILQKSELCEAAQDNSYQNRNKPDESHETNPNFMVDNLIRSQLSLLDGGNLNIDSTYGEASCSNSGWRNQASPVRQWMEKLASPDLEAPEPSSKLPPGLKENTLKAKLLEARSKGPRARLKTFKLFS